MLKKLSAVLCAVAVATVFSLGTSSAAPMVLKFAGQSAVDHPATDFMKKVASEIKEKTEGRVEVKIYPANQLGNYSTVYQEQIQGTIAMSCISVPSDFDPRMELVYINGYVSSYERAKEVFAPSGWLFGKMDELNDRLGVKLLGFFIEGFIGTASTRPAVEPINPKVAKDVVVRIPNMNVYKLGAESTGYKTMTIPYPDVYQALQTKVVDGVNGYPVAAAYTALADVIKYWYNTNYSIEVLNCMISKKVWEKISPEDQKVISEIFTRGTIESINNAKAVDDHYMEMMRKKGIKVFTYSEEELAPMMKAITATWPQLKKNMSPELIDEFIKELAPK
ncbi:MAG: C4-dicarboxylate ABC transporter substrate-binding protein [Proteobacteria bacterium]|nr:MAG: C4-dicarboxylate ABC transporter substrate-binding protein [Pseudomonadota bacterium]PIE65240.1 MAG: C4-dicarboxylate ABC transporter substrate-binding protein [Desulfobacterales bacterium]